MAYRRSWSGYPRLSSSQLLSCQGLRQACRRSFLDRSRFNFGLFDRRGLLPKKITQLGGGAPLSLDFGLVLLPFSRPLLVNLPFLLFFLFQDCQGRRGVAIPDYRLGLHFRNIFRHDFGGFFLHFGHIFRGLFLFFGAAGPRSSTAFCLCCSRSRFSLSISASISEIDWAHSSRFPAFSGLAWI